MTVGNIEILDKPVVELIQVMGSDLAICEAAWVSTNRERFMGTGLTVNTDEIPEQEAFAKKQKGLINYLMKMKHGTPFEHAALKFYVSAPIFTFREFHRHRIGFSYNEMSARYTEMPPQFYIPDSKRPLVNFGSSARPDFRMPQTHEEFEKQIEIWVIVHDDLMDGYEHAWKLYKHMLDAGAAKEIARAVLPVGIYSRMYVTCNPRSLMNFLSLRVHDEAATHVSHPQYEIQQVAKEMEKSFASLFPLTYEAYINNGRVAP